MFTPFINSLDKLDLITILLHLSIMNVLNLISFMCIFNVQLHFQSQFPNIYKNFLSINTSIFLKTEKCDVEDMTVVMTKNLIKHKNQ